MVPAVNDPEELTDLFPKNQKNKIRTTQIILLTAKKVDMDDKKPIYF